MLSKFSLCFIAFMQALGLGIYLSLVSVLFLKGNELFGRVPNYWGPLLFLFLFVTSALVSAILVLGYPFILFWQKKQLEKAIRLVIYTTAWLIGFIILLLLLIFLSKN